MSLSTLSKAFFFHIYDVYIDRRFPFDRLFDNDSKGGNLVSTGSVVPEASLVFPTFLIYPLLEPLPGVERSIVPMSFLHSQRSPFLGIFMMWPSFQSDGTFSSSQMAFMRWWSMLVEVLMSALRASAGIPSGPCFLSS